MACASSGTAAGPTRSPCPTRPGKCALWTRSICSRSRAASAYGCISAAEAILPFRNGFFRRIDFYPLRPTLPPLDRNEADSLPNLLGGGLRFVVVIMAQEASQRPEVQ